MYSKTSAVNNVSFWRAYDQAAASGSSFSSNSDQFFSLQVTFGGSPGGSVSFDFQFILGGSYSNVSNSGINVILQNVYVNTYDIDGNGTAIQNNEFGGFSTSELGTTTNGVIRQYLPFNLLPIGSCLSLQQQMLWLLIFLAV